MADHPKPDSNIEDHHHSSKEAKSLNLVESEKGGVESLFDHKSSGHHKETHGTSDDIDESISTSEVKAPNVFERVKEEVEALVEAFHPKKDTKDDK